MIKKFKFDKKNSIRNWDILGITNNLIDEGTAISLDNEMLIYEEPYF